MRKQQDIWQTEHTTHVALPAHAAAAPSSMVVRFVEYLHEQTDTRVGKAVDIGCGRGRNAIYLAEQGFDVQAMDYIAPALDATDELALTRNVSDIVHTSTAEIDMPWPFPDNYFDIAIDNYASIDIETLEGRKTCRDEMYRTLKPGGYCLVAVVSITDEWEAEAYRNHPGPEPNSVIWPENQKFQKDYDEAELREFYAKFAVLELKEVKKTALKLGRQGIATDLWMVLQKRDT